VNVLFTVKMSV